MQNADQILAERVSSSRKLAALALYGAVSIVFIGRALFPGFTDFHLGQAVDSSFLMWALVWWPYALRHGLNPFLCRLIWAPDGFNLAWSGGIPLVSLMAAPLTASAGPVATYNALCLAAPALAAWCAFLLCCRLGGRYYPALLGGYIFGFSSYMLGQLIGGHLNLLLVFPAPLIAMIVIARLRRAIAPAPFVALLALTFVAQFLCSIELAATSVIFGVVALMVSWYFANPEDRTRLWGLVVPLACAGGVCLVALSPYVYYLILPGAPRGAINSPGGYSADLANLLIPTRTAQLGLLPAFQALARRFPGNTGERDAYLGLPLFMVICHFGWTRRREPGASLLVVLFAIILICALGPRLRLGGWTGFGMPWKLVMHVPLIKSALPGRFMNYAFLVAAITASLWLADHTVRWCARTAFGVLIIAASLPNLDVRTWAAPTTVPAFFSTGSFLQYIGPGENVIALPYGIGGDTMLWQAVARMSFRMAGGYTGITPREFERWPIVSALTTGTYIPDVASQLLAFMTAHDADVVLVAETRQEFWAPALTAVDSMPRKVGGVWLYRARATLLTHYRETPVLEWERRAAESRFAALVAAAHAYLNAGNDPAALSPLRAQQLGFLPARWVKDHDIRTDNGLYLAHWPGGGVAVGVVGSYEALQPLIAKYRVHATKVFFPYPKELDGEPTGETFMRLLVMVFKRETLPGAITAAGQAKPASFDESKPPPRFVR